VATAQEIMDVLREKLWTDGAHAWMYEVANATGGRASRYADALVCSCWPSRGLWLAGIEAKVSRSDWTRERDMPEKSAPIQKYCRYWWLVTTPNIARPEEIPELWGHIEVNGKHRILKQAPELKPEPPTIDLVASIVRNTAKTSEFTIQQRANKMIEVERAHLREQQEKLDTINRELGSSSKLIDRYRELKENCEKFHRETGLEIDRGYSLDTSIETIKLAQKLTGFNGVARLRKRLIEMHNELAELDVETDPS